LVRRGFGPIVYVFARALPSYDPKQMYFFFFYTQVFYSAAPLVDFHQNEDHRQPFWHFSPIVLRTSYDSFGDAAIKEFDAYSAAF